MPTRNITPEDLYHLHILDGCQVSPDGRHAVFCVDRIDAKTQKKYKNLFVVSTAEGTLRQFTHGDYRDHSPKWSPDGTAIAFISNRREEKAADGYIIPFDGGEARLAANIEGQVFKMEWSPDGKRLVLQARLKDSSEVEREKDPVKKELGIVSRHITRVLYKFESKGFLPRERTHLWIVEVDSGRVRQLTKGEVYDETSPAWSPDGQRLVFCSNRSPEPDLDPDAVDLFVIPADGGNMEKIPTPLGSKDLPGFSPDGKWISYACREGRGGWWKNTGLWIVPADGGGEAIDLTGRFDIAVGPGTLNDIPGHLPMVRPVWSADGSRIFFQVSREGRTTLQRLTVDDRQAEPVPVVDANGVVDDFSLSGDGKTLACVFTDMTRPSEILKVDLETGQEKVLTDINHKVMDQISLGAWEEFRIKGATGNDLQGWIITPPDFDPQKTYPSILEIHGGPHAQYGAYFMHEFHFLAAQGYVVYFCNPRGSLGYGEAHARAIDNNWGTLDYEDVMAVADFMLTKPYIDPDRRGVTGGSYGGYMTNWIIGHTDRFKAAVTQRSVSNMISMYGSSDFNWSFEYELGGRPPWENMENYWRQSPIKHIGRAKTPTLVIHSEQDLRCPLEQGEQIYVALKRLGVDTEMIVYPEESHELSRAGRTDRRIDRLTHILRWFDRYLK